MAKIKNIIRHPLRYLEVALNRLFYYSSRYLNDEAYLKITFRRNMGYWPNLKEPKTFNEKLQWLKLYDRKPEYTIMVDKVKAKDYVAGIIGEEHIIPTLGVWERPEDIDFDALPNQFVLKCNHNSGTGMYICKDKSKVTPKEWKNVLKELRKGLRENYYLHCREWPYKDVPRRILAEKFMVDGSQNDGLKDYKFMCFDGKVNCSFVCSDRSNDEGLKVTFFDNQWNKLPFTRHYPASDKEIDRPSQLQAMIACAEKLSKDIPFVRTDFYEIDGKYFFGELTFFPGSGMEEFTPDEWDEKIGSWIKLPNGGVSNRKSILYTLAAYFRKSTKKFDRL